MTGIKEVPKISAEIIGNPRLSHVTEDIFELSLTNLKKSIVFKTDSSSNTSQTSLSLRDVIDQFYKTNTTFSVGINGAEYKVKIVELNRSSGAVRIMVQSSNISRGLSLSGTRSIVLKASVPVAQNVKASGPVLYNNAQPFTFRIFQSYNLPAPDKTWNANGTISLVNKGAIFYYNATATTINNILGFKYILVNTPNASFVPNSSGVVSLTGADFYYGWFNPSTTYPNQYVDFYVYKSQVNNYLYKFTVEAAIFFTSAKFPKTKTVTIA